MQASMRWQVSDTRTAPPLHAGLALRRRATQRAPSSGGGACTAARN